MHTTRANYDPDVVRWGLHELEGGGGYFAAGNNNPTNTNTNTNTYPYPAETPEPHLMTQSPADVHYNTVNDEAIAHAFQEELSKLRDTKESADDSSKAAVLNQNWQDFNSSHGETSYNLDPLGEPEEYYGQPGDYRKNRLTGYFQSFSVGDQDTMGPRKRGSSSSSKARNSPPDYDSYQHGDDEENLKLALALSTSEEQHQLDNEVAKRLTKLDSIRHVPRVNADELPTLDDASLDHARLMEREVNSRSQPFSLDCPISSTKTQVYSITVSEELLLNVLQGTKQQPLKQWSMVRILLSKGLHSRACFSSPERLIMYGLNERQIQGDGNCQFRALSDQLYRTPDHHKFVRKTIVQQLKAHADVYEGYVTMPYSEYLKKMAKSGEWGDHVTLQAAADSYGVKIGLITSFKDTSSIEILPDRVLSNRGAAKGNREINNLPKWRGLSEG